MGVFLLTILALNIPPKGDYPVVLPNIYGI